MLTQAVAISLLNQGIKAVVCSTDLLSGAPAGCVISKHKSVTRAVAESLRLPHTTAKLVTDFIQRN